jgi:FkbM family methyltransferase
VIPTDPSEIAEAQWSGLSGQLAFDVGAHLGENFAALARCGAKRIVGFEPEAALFAELERLWLGPADDPVQDPAVTLSSSAIAGQAGLLEMRRANGMLGWMTGEERVTVPAISLDDAAGWYGPPDVVAVDVEGYEAQVLAGAQGVLDSRRADWLIEFHSEPLYYIVDGMLRGYGYKPQVIRHPHYPARSDLWLGHGWIKALRP